MIEPGRTAVLCDAVGTLIYPCPGVVDAYDAAAQRFGSSLPPESIRLRFREAFVRQETIDASAVPPHRTDEVRERQRWRTIVGQVFPDMQDCEGVFNALWDHFAQPQHWRVYDDVAPCFDQLRIAGYGLGIASNFDDRLDAICHAHETLAGISRFVSSRIGYKKPSPEFFCSIERSLNLPAEKILLVGDDLENDYHAARRAGWQAVLLDRDGCGRNVTATIASLRDLAP